VCVEEGKEQSRPIIVTAGSSKKPKAAAVRTQNRGREAVENVDVKGKD
jgi:hypothetical protein